MRSIQRILRNALVYGLAQGISRLQLLIALPFLSRHLTPEDYGVIGVLALTGAALRIVFGGGVTAAAGVVYFQSEDPAHRATTIWTLWLLLCCLGAALFLFVAVTTAQITQFIFPGYDGLDPLITLYAVALALNLVGEAPNTRLQFAGKAATFGIASVGCATIAVGLSIYLVVEQQLGVSGWIWAQVGGGIATVVLAGAFAMRGLGAPHISWHTLRRLAHVGMPLVPGSIAVLIILQSGPFFVSRMVSIADAGIFSIGYQLGSAMMMATSALQTAWTPYFQGFVNRQEEASTLFPTLTNGYVVMVGGICVLFFVFSAPAVAVIAGEDFRSSWMIVGPVALSQMLLGLWTMLLPGMYYAVETRHISFMQVCSAIVTISLHIILIPLYGPMGAALALLGGGAALILLQIAMNRWRGYLVRTIAPVSFASLLCLLAATCAAVWSSWAVLGLSVKGAMASAVAVCGYAASTWIFMRLQAGTWVLRPPSAPSAE